MQKNEYESTYCTVVGYGPGSRPAQKIRGDECPASGYGDTVYNVLLIIIFVVFSWTCFFECQKAGPYCGFRPRGSHVLLARVVDYVFM